MWPGGRRAHNNAQERCRKDRRISSGDPFFSFSFSLSLFWLCVCRRRSRQDSLCGQSAPRFDLPPPIFFLGLCVVLLGRGRFVALCAMNGPTEKEHSINNNKMRRSLRSCLRLFAPTCVCPFFQFHTNKNPENTVQELGLDENGKNGPLTGIRRGPSRRTGLSRGAVPRGER
jgi:hypothetical protein